MKTQTPGAEVVVLADDSDTLRDFPSYALSSGNKLLSQETTDGVTKFTFRKT